MSQIQSVLQFPRIQVFVDEYHRESTLPQKTQQIVLLQQFVIGSSATISPEHVRNQQRNRGQIHFRRKFWVFRRDPNVYQLFD